MTTPTDIAKMTAADLDRLEQIAHQIVEKCRATRANLVAQEAAARSKPFGALAVPLFRLGMSDASLGATVGHTLTWLVSLERRIREIQPPTDFVPESVKMVLADQSLHVAEVETAVTALRDDMANLGGVVGEIRAAQSRDAPPKGKLESEK